MRGFIGTVFAAAAAVLLAGCGNQDTAAPVSTEAVTVEAVTETASEEPESTSSSYDLAFIIGLGTIDDGAVNQEAFLGVEKYAEENHISYHTYQAKEGTTEACAEAVALAVEGGAKVVVCPEALFEESVFIAQDQYPEVHFILLDGQPHNADYSEFRTNANVMSVQYAEEQAGYLAGYAAVKEGLTKLGFLGGMAVPSIICYGYGYVQGADAAAAEMGVLLDIRYHYAGSFVADEEVRETAASWYQHGTEVIFGCGGTVGNAVMEAAEEAGGKVIGADADQSAESDTVITSAVKLSGISVYDGIKAYYEGTFQGGEESLFTAQNKGIGLPMETSRFETFTQKAYDAVYQRLASNEIVIYKNTEDGTTADIPLTSAKVSFIT